MPPEIRALVTFMSSLNIGGLDGGSARPSPMLPVPIDATSPHAELSTVPPPTSTSPPLASDVHHTSVASVAPPPDANPEPTRVVASASSEPSPDTHPTFAASPEEATLVEMAQVLTTETDDANATLSPQPAPSSSPNTTSTSSGSPSPVYIQPACGHQECGRAGERIRAINRMFAATNRDMAAHPQASTQDLARAADAAYEVLSHCGHPQVPSVAAPHGERVQPGPARPVLRPLRLFGHPPGDGACADWGALTAELAAGVAYAGGWSNCGRECSVKCQWGAGLFLIVPSSGSRSVVYILLFRLLCCYSVLLRIAVCYPSIVPVDLHENRQIRFASL